MVAENTSRCVQYYKEHCWTETRKISKAVVSWGFHKLVCYHILIRKAPLRLQPSIWCGAVAQEEQETKHNYRGKITH